MHDILLGFTCCQIFRPCRTFATQLSSTTRRFAISSIILSSCLGAFIISHSSNLKLTFFHRSSAFVLSFGTNTRSICLWHPGELVGILVFVHSHPGWVANLLAFSSCLKARGQLRKVSISVHLLEELQRHPCPKAATNCAWLFAHICVALQVQIVDGSLLTGTKVFAMRWFPRWRCRRKFSLRKTIEQVKFSRCVGVTKLYSTQLFSTILAGEIITRTRTKGTELNELYNTMKEALVYFTHLVSPRCEVIMNQSDVVDFCALTLLPGLSWNWKIDDGEIDSTSEWQVVP